MKHYLGSTQCTCGKEHDIPIDDVVVGKGTLARLPEFVAKYNAQRPFILADRNTYKAAGERVAQILDRCGISYHEYVFPSDNLEPDEQAVGSAVMHFDSGCDLIIGVGSGVINDIGKILSSVSGRRYIIVGTAPSMDGYASATSSMSRDGLKVSIPSRCADVIIGDTDILKNAPEHMLKAGLGDMLAKYVSIAEWRIAHLITGEYYCEQVAQLIRSALKKCVDNAQGLLARDEAAVQAVFEGLVIGGVAMAYAGVSRPASGIEHYFSHVWDMRGLEFGTQVDLHGIQCAMATLKSVELYEAVKRVVPERNKASAAVAAFDYTNWSTQLRSFLGRSGETMIAQEQKEQKYDKSTHSARFEKIADNWRNILAILEEELPSASELAALMNNIGLSRDLNAIGVDRECAKLSFKATKDIRDKYVLSRLAWDLGILDELAELL
ncbi:MAG: sn-glycerol-1-phosphate dehydrogenase [Ruminococcaceae bacterium]|nr:sn-glycerol-1-phosphate dehydrogenase [Oscillospiraceae bacterium]